MACRSLRALLMVALLWPSLGRAAASNAPDTGFLNRKVTVGGVTYRYEVYLPETWNAREKWPVILFLHGSGERGSDGMAETEVGLPSAIRVHPERWPFIVVMPQVPYNHHYWPDPDMMAQAMAALDEATTEFHGDRERTYLTGMSLGGYGTWEIAKTYPHRFAAIVPVCGGLHWSWIPGGRHLPGLEAEYARTIGKTPVWMFHGQDDPVVSPEQSRMMFAALKAEGGNVRYWELQGIQHNAWDRAYWNPEVPQWLLAHKLSDINTLPAVAEMRIIPFQPAPIRIDPAIYAKYTGVYSYYGMPQATITVKDGALVAKTRAGSSVLLPETPTTFFFPGGGATRYVFVKNAQGDYDELIFKDDRHEEHWTRTGGDEHEPGHAVQTAHP